MATIYSRQMPNGNEYCAGEEEQILAVHPHIIGTVVLCPKCIEVGTQAPPCLLPLYTTLQCTLCQPGKTVL